MFTLARTPTAHATSSASAAKQAIIASLPPPASPLMHSPVMPSNRVASPSPDARRLTGPLFGPAPHPQLASKAVQASSPGGTSHRFQRQSFARDIHASPKEGFRLSPASPRNSNMSPKPALKSCLKSPQTAKSPTLNGVKSPRFASTMVSIKSRDGPLWKYIHPLEEGQQDHKHEGVLERWKRCRERVPTPYGTAAEATEYFSSKNSVDH